MPSQQLTVALDNHCAIDFSLLPAIDINDASNTKHCVCSCEVPIAISAKGINSVLTPDEHPVSSDGATLISLSDMAWSSLGPLQKSCVPLSRLLRLPETPCLIILLTHLL